jgi:hypothetical protein
MILGLRQRLLEAVQIRLHPDAPMGVYLSGGIDSSAVAGMAAHLLKEESVASDQVRTATQQRVTAFCIGFDQASGFDESCKASIGFTKPTGQLLIRLANSNRATHSRCIGTSIGHDTHGREIDR